MTNGVYAGSVGVANPLTLRSVNGPQVTVIDGGRTNGCVGLADGACLSGFTLTHGRAYFAGGVSCSYTTNAVVTNCIIVDNSAPGWTADGWGGGVSGGACYNCVLTGNSAAYGGGGAAYSTLYNCTLTGNSVVTHYGTGGGAFASTLYNCTLTGNSASYWNNTTGVGGVSQSTLYNCIVCYNTASEQQYGANYDASSTLNYCCTAPQPATGAGNITSAPAFVDYTNGNLRLQSNSLCINAGNNAYVTAATDLDGRPRIVGGRVDMGAYEFQPGVSGAFIGWLQRYGLPTNGSADSADADADGMNNWQEWICGTDPTNPLSALSLLSAVPTGTNFTVSWQSVSGVTYSLARSANLAAPFTFVATNIIGQAGTTTYGDTTATGAGPFFYRVGVNSP